jgi:hypothetical protein
MCGRMLTYAEVDAGGLVSVYIMKALLQLLQQSVAAVAPVKIS